MRCRVVKEALRIHIIAYVASLFFLGNIIVNILLYYIQLCFILLSGYILLYTVLYFLTLLEQNTTLFYSSLLYTTPF